MTLPGFRHFVVEQSATQVYAFLSAYLVGGLEGHYYPNLYSPSGVDIDATVASADANKDIVRGIKGHAEIGGFARADMHGYNTEVPAPPGTPAQHYDDENHPFRGQARFSLTQAR